MADEVDERAEQCPVDWCLRRIADLSTHELDVRVGRRFVDGSGRCNVVLRRHRSTLLGGRISRSCNGGRARESAVVVGGEVLNRLTIRNSARERDHQE